MSVIIDKNYRILGRGAHEIDLQAWRTEKLASVEYHAFVSIDGVWMIIRIADPNDPFSEQLYSMGREPKSDLDNAWTNRATITYVRYDKVLETFFS